MLYCSGVLDNGRILEITDTDDNTVEQIKNKDVYKYISENKNSRIYGCFKWNHAAEARALTNEGFHKGVLIKLLDNLKKIHNQWEQYKVADYICFAPVGIKFTVYTIENGDRCVATVEKIEEDKWIFHSDGSVADGYTGNSDFAAHMLDIVYCSYGRVLRFVVSGV